MRALAFSGMRVHYERSMKFWSTARQSRWSGRAAVAGLMLLLWVGTFALVVSPQLHRLLHRDAQGPAHNCLITQIQHQQLLSGLAAVIAPVPGPAVPATDCRAEVEILPAGDYRLSPSRAPPFQFSSPTVVG
jgi:hypothetical protein